MKLFLYPHAPYSRKVMVAAAERGWSFAEEQVVPPFDGQAMAALRRDEHPLATVPLVRLDDGSHLLDSSIICEHVDRWAAAAAGGTAVLVPEDPAVSLEVRTHDRLAEQLLGATVHLTWALSKPKEKQNVAKIDVTRDGFRTALAQLDARLNGRSFVCVEAFTLADIGPLCAIADAVTVWSSEAELDPFPRVQRWYAAVTARASWQAVLAASARVRPPFAERKPGTPGDSTA